MSTENNILHRFEGLSLWEHFKNDSGASSTDIAMVEKHIDYAMPLLDHYTEAFRKYTLHNDQHQKNIIKIIGNLLGPHIQKLTALECAMLLLSAVYHDIGMVYSKEDLSVISTEPKFQIFLQENARAMVEYEENDRKSNDSLIEWFCRSMHAERVWVHLNKVDSIIPLRWENVSIKNSLGNLCESHNFSVDRIISERSNFNNDYLGKCDLVFCSILLRLADILDFDNTRSPKSVYEFLDLDNPKNKLDAFSQLEWEKHLNSNGFVFNWSINDDVVKTVFSATTPHPNIEIAIKSFIGTITSELASCYKLQKFCSTKWHEHPLPQEIDIQNLTAENYQSGDYHFSLSEDKILDLLTGDGLYNNEFVFIRELLQNAIDTSRHREFHEHQTNKLFTISPINVSFFTDKMGYQWIRIDDFGMGMNEDIIVNHLLKKGDSYYNSDKFKLEKIKINKTLSTDFVPISRFGIGLLSCFMAGDKIEISTKHIASGTESFRLGIEGRNAHYVLQSQNKHHAPIPMPSQLIEKEGYRDIVGTSIAVRITTNKEFWGFNLKKELETFIICSPVPILYEETIVGGKHEEIVNEPWVDDEIIPIDSKFVKKLEETFNIEFQKGIDIVIENINITQKSLNPNLKGQIVFIAVDTDYKSDGIFQDIGFKLSFDNEILTLSVSATKKEGEGKEIEVQEVYDLSFLLYKFKNPNIFKINPFKGESFSVREKLLLSHNGIVINDPSGKFSLDRDLINKSLSNSYNNNFSFIYTGILYFQDELLPELSVSRNEIKALSFQLISNLSFSLISLNKYFQDSSENFKFFRKYRSYEDFTSAEIEKSGFYIKNRIFLDSFITLAIDGKIFTIQELKEQTITEKQFSYSYFRNTFYDDLVHFIIEQNFDITITIDENDCNCTFFITSRSISFPKSLNGFTPLTFVNFKNDDRLAFGHRLNLTHPFVRWYLMAANTLDTEFFYYSKQLIYTLFNTNKTFAFDNCTNILKRLDTILPEDLKPNKSFMLKQSDLR